MRLLNAFSKTEGLKNRKKRENVSLRCANRIVNNDISRDYAKSYFI